MKIVDLVPAVTSLIHVASAMLDAEISSKSSNGEDVARFTNVKFVLDQLPGMLYDDGDEAVVKAAYATSRITMSHSKPTERFVILDEQSPASSVQAAQAFITKHKK